MGVSYTNINVGEEIFMISEKKSVKLAVVGGRDFSNYTLLKETLDQCQYKISCIVSGGAKGADSLGMRYAAENAIETLIFKPDWKQYGRGAGIIRNRTIVDNCDLVYAFWDGSSKGTKNTIDYAIKIEKSVNVISY